MQPSARLAVAVAALAVAGCAGLDRALEARKPAASVDGVRLAAIDFDRAELVFDVRIDNPNPVGLELAGFDYALDVAGRELLSGRRDRRLALPAEGAETIAVPVAIRFDRVAGTLGDLRGRDRVPYGLELGLDVELPVVGVRRVSAATEGNLPVPHRPDLELRRARVAELGLSGARLVLELAVANPNAFDLHLDRVGYALAVDGEPWAEGRASEAVRLAPRGRTTLALPLDVRFGVIGIGASELLRGGATADYRLSVDIAGRAGLEGFAGFSLPLERRGRIELER